MIAEDTWGQPYNGSAITDLISNPSQLGPVGTTGGAGFDLMWDYQWHFTMVIVGFT